MKNKFENNTFTAYLEGHVDTNNAEQVGEEVNTLWAEHPGSSLCLDCENLSYISSAILIDIDTLSVGNPIFEFASIYLAYIGYGEIDHTNVENFLKLDWDNTNYIFNKLVDDYFAGQPKESVESTILKAKAVAYTRALRRTIKREPEKKNLIEHYKKQLIETVDKI